MNFCKFRKILIEFLCLIMLLQAFNACKSPSNSPDTTQESFSATDESVPPGNDNPDPMPQNGYSGYLDEYRIVRAGAIVDPFAGAIGTRLTEALSKVSGKEVKAVLDTKHKDDGTKEILIGLTNRVESEDAIAALDVNEFSISVMGNKIVIVGENHIALDQGVKYFVKHYIYDIQSVSEIKNYRSADPYGYSPISELNQYMYGEQVCSYAGCIQQDIAMDFATGDIYYFSHDQFVEHGAAITRRTPDGHQEYMLLTNFAHMEVCDIERVGDKVYIWSGSQLLPNGGSSAMSRFEFQAGTRYDWNTGETVTLGGNVHCPAFDPINDYIANWGSVYDRESLLQGKPLQIATFKSEFPSDKELGYTPTYCVSGGFDICGSYMYTCYQTFDQNHNNKILITVNSVNGDLVDWTFVDHAALGLSDPEVNGIKAELVDGVPRVFVAIANDSGINRRYHTTIVVFSERDMDLVEPTTESLSQLKTVEHNALPKNAEGMSWTETDGVFSVKAIGNVRLTFDEGAFKGEAYTYETTVTMNGAQKAGMNLACSANVSNAEFHYHRNDYIGVQIFISEDGKLIVKETESTILKEYTIPKQTTYKLKVDVSELGKVTIILNDNNIGELQLTTKNYFGGHVGLFAENGSASFSDTKLTYHRS